MPLVLTLGMVAMCNLTLLSAMAAGRSARRWRRRFFLGAEVLFLVAAVMFAIFTGMATGLHDGSVAGVLALIGLILSMVLAGLLTYVEYRLAGQGQRFSGDLQRSIWLGPRDG